MLEDVKLDYQLKNIPNESGIYQYFDKDNRLLYVGKAKNLKKRVHSYFQKTHASKKLHNLVRKIRTIEYIITYDEYEALLLENNIIKDKKPFYNVQLRDDKTYPWICIKYEPFPRVFSTREFIKDGSEYYGPYSSLKIVKSLLGFIYEVYTLRSCSLDLHPKKIAKKKYKVCLEYHIKNCKGPCQGFEGEEEYQKKIKSIRNILNGNFQEPLKFMKEGMLIASKNLHFEKAQEFKEKIEILKKYQSRSVVVNPLIDNVDVFSEIEENDFTYVNFMKIAHGCIIQSYNLELKKRLDETQEDLFIHAIVYIRELFKSQSKEIYLSKKLPLKIPGVKISLPQVGDKRKIIDLSLYNLKYYKKDRLEKLRHLDPSRHKDRIMKGMKEDLNLEEEPRYIECFDNSNLQGTNPVSACVVFREGKPSKKEYRKFSIKSIEGPDDFASMKEVVYRRYKKLWDQKEPLPQLIVIDGVKGQLSAALESLDKLGLKGKIQILSIAKKLEEIYFPNDPNPLYLDKSSETLKIIQHIRDEAHRFGISYHREKRSQKALHSELGYIQGIGEKSTQLLLSHFSSFKAILNASMEELEKLVGKDKAKKIYHYFLLKKKE